MVINRLGDVKAVPVTMAGAADVMKQLVIGKADGTPAFSMRVFTVAPGGHTPFHSHPFEHINYVLSGSGLVRGADGDTPIGPGDSILVLPGDMHQYRNAGDEPFVFICLVVKEYE
jgi:quercetin dioxygenase-like cupin family protein